MLLAGWWALDWSYGEGTGRVGGGGAYVLGDFKRAGYGEVSSGNGV